MTTSTPSPARRDQAARAFTLVEILVSTGLMGFLLLGILTTFLFLGRSSANLVNYSDMEFEARKALELFAEDTRQASAMSWVDANTITLTVAPDTITYGYDATAHNFYRTVGTTRKDLIHSVSNFTFQGYQINTTTPVDTSNLSTAALRTAASNVTKQIQISMKASRATMTVVGATNNIFSARYIMRNKKVTN